jgi:hypothetical protein
MKLKLLSLVLELNGSKAAIQVFLNRGEVIDVQVNAS